MTPKQKIKAAKNVYVGTLFDTYDINYVRVTKKALRDEIKYGFNGELDDEKFVLRDDLDLYIN
jgi:hypothetical protein|tara:strand:+ start:251 stop:439 length:189 start_codon:yes stop_codon:yes gene_type:complete